MRQRWWVWALVGLAGLWWVWSAAGLREGAGGTGQGQSFASTGASSRADTWTAPSWDAGGASWKYPAVEPTPKPARRIEVSLSKPICMGRVGRDDLGQWYCEERRLFGGSGTEICDSYGPCRRLTASEEFQLDFRVEWCGSLWDDACQDERGQRFPGTDEPSFPRNLWDERRDDVFPRGSLWGQDDLFPRGSLWGEDEGAEDLFPRSSPWGEDRQHDDPFSIAQPWSDDDRDRSRWP